MYSVCEIINSRDLNYPPQLLGKFNKFSFHVQNKLNYAFSWNDGAVALLIESYLFI